MSGSGKGGMQTAGLNYSIYCPKCGKPAARIEHGEREDKYLHFTKKGSVWHIVRRPPGGEVNGTK